MYSVNSKKEKRKRPMAMAMDCDGKESYDDGGGATDNTMLKLAGDCGGGGDCQVIDCREGGDNPELAGTYLMIKCGQRPPEWRSFATCSAE